MDPFSQYIDKIQSGELYRKKYLADSVKKPGGALRSVPAPGAQDQDPFYQSLMKGYVSRMILLAP